jgi:hypothetical protein
VHVKAIVRTDTPNGIRLLPAGSAIDIRVEDSRSREVDRRTVTLNRWSAAEWTWTVPADSTLGNYSVRALLPGTEAPSENRAARRTQASWLRQVTGSFLVAAYRRPDFRVDATLSTAAPIAGAALSGTLDARYLFGTAMSASCSLVDYRGRPSIFLRPSAGAFPDRYAFGYYPDRRSGAGRIAGADAALDAPAAEGHCNGRTRRGFRVSLHTRGRCRASPASTSPIARASSFIRRRGTSA